ncbi:MAG: PAS domain-containing protein [Myxococcota bacterium]|jgi:PAS domain-containing protein|nr:PAS domain-containing protein [Myxococcota bacterium]
MTTTSRTGTLPPTLDWVEAFPAAITVCDREGTILSMNARSRATFAKAGGEALLGSSLFDCHPAAASEKIRELLSSAESNAYTIEKDGVRKLIFQAPWFLDGECAGLVELSLVLPPTMPHHVRG